MKKTLLVAAIGVIVAATASPALASGFALALTAPPAVVGHPMV